MIEDEKVVVQFLCIPSVLYMRIIPNFTRRCNSEFHSFPIAASVQFTVKPSVDGKQLV
jgi:hypothetical protein